MKTWRFEKWIGFIPLLSILIVHSEFLLAGEKVFDVTAYGATGKIAEDARTAIQSAIDACAAAGGGMVYLPPGQYTSGTLHLRSHVRFYLEAGATLYASPDPKAYDYGQIPSKAALIYGDNLENISIEGRGVVEGQAEYEWRPDDFERGYNHKIMMEKLGKPLQRSFPKGFPQREIFPHLLWLGNCKDVQIRGLTFLHSPSWTMAFYACEGMVIEGLYIYTSLKEAVWADGIDIDGCKDIRIANCRIETGDDCIIFISMDSWGPARLCENITVTNCILSSASAAVKFSEGNKLGVKNIAINNCVITDTNRGFVFTTTMGGSISDVVIANLTMDLHRYEWFWDGDGQPFYFRITRLSEWNQESPKPGEAPPGAIRNVMIHNVIAHAQGGSLIAGHPESWLDGVSFENIKLFLSADPTAPYELTRHGMDFQWARNLRLKDVEIKWEDPVAREWDSALSFDGVNNLTLEGFSGRPAWTDRDSPAIKFNNVSESMIGNSQALAGTGTFLKVSGTGSHGIYLLGNDFRMARIPYELDKEVAANAVGRLSNFPVE
ncbi:MAG: glycosyl hydrolase family 28 protein [Terriglobia bacterium]